MWLFTLTMLLTLNIPSKPAVASDTPQPETVSDTTRTITMTTTHRSDEPRPDVENIIYGPHERNVMDLYRAPGPEPHPLLFWIHGGGFKYGDKQRILPELFAMCLERGISVTSISYRLSQDAIYPASFHDSRRALQYVRHHAADLGIDPDRIAAAGNSAGAGMSCWLAFRPDMADPDSVDPVLRQSTRVRCVVTTEGQTSYDPRFIAEVVGGNAHTHPALALLFGVSPDIWPQLDRAAVGRVEDGAAINFLTSDDPPVFGIYKRENRAPTDDDDPNFGIHHPRFGHHLKERMDVLGIECIIYNDPRLADDRGARTIAHEKAAAFVARWLGVE